MKHPIIDSIPFSKENKERVEHNLSTKTSEEIALLENEAAEALNLAQKALEPTWWHYILVRKELAGGPAMAQAAHAAGYSAAKLGTELPPRTRICILSATKEQFADVFAKIQARNDISSKTLYAMYESEGTLAGCYTSLGFLTSDKQSIIDVVGGLDLWRK